MGCHQPNADAEKEGREEGRRELPAERYPASIRLGQGNSATSWEAKDDLPPTPPSG